MLESLEQSNIKKMSVETPEQKEELLFDPKKEITEEEWGRIEKEMLEDKSLIPPMFTLAQIKFIDPGHLPKVDYGDLYSFKSALWSREAHISTKHVSFRLDDLDVRSLIMVGAAAKLFYPELNERIRASKEWLVVDECFKDVMNYNADTRKLAAQYKLVFPDKSPVGEMHREQMVTAIFETHDLAPDIAVRDVGYYRILFPNQPSPVSFTEEDWEKIKTVLHGEIDSQFSIRSSVELAFCSLVAQAKKIEINDQGLQLKFNDEKISESELMPEQKQF